MNNEKTILQKLKSKAKSKGNGKLLCLIVILSLLVSGCAKKEEGSQGFMWKVENDKNVVYLLGSIHVGREDMYPLRQSILKAYAESDYVYIEVDITRKLDSKEQLEIQKKMFFQDDTLLQDVVSLEVYKIIEEKLKVLGYDIKSFEKFKPGFISDTLTALTSKQWIEEYGFSIDKYFLNKAKEDNKMIVELEGQLLISEIQDSFSMELQNYLLESSLDLREEDIKNVMDSGIDYWINGDKEQSIKMELDEFEGNQLLIDEYYDKILRKRNERISNVIQDLLEADEGKTYFVICGAAHFLAEDNIIDSLIKKGYKVIEQ